MVWNVIFSYINNEITGVGYGRIASSVIMSCVVVKKVEVAVIHAACSSVPLVFSKKKKKIAYPSEKATTHAATSA